MCGRYTLKIKKVQDLYDRYEVYNKYDNYTPHFNAAPGQNLPVITMNSPKTIQEMRWGLIPFWAKDPRIGFKTINARAEGITEKPTYRKPLKSQRCIIPVDGFYEWKVEGKEKVPYYIRLPKEEIFSLAGLYDIWKDPTGLEIKTFTIITVKPNELMEKIHDRMPAILRKDEEELWIDNKGSDVSLALQLLKSYPAELMEAYPVSKNVNNSRLDEPSLIEPTT